MSRRRRRNSPLIIASILISILAIVSTAVLVIAVAMGNPSGLSSIFAFIGPAKGGPPQPQQVAKDYFPLWNDGKYDEMYGMLSEASKSQIPQDRFITRYTNVGIVVGITAITADVKSPQQANSPSGTPATTANLSYNVAFESSLLGKFGEENELPMVLEEDRWRVEWSPDLIFKGLTDDNRVSVSTAGSVRGDIVDRKGKPLATNGKVSTVGLVPRAIKNEGQVLSALSGYLGIKQEAIKAQYANVPSDWWVPLKDIPAEKRADAVARLGAIPGIEVRENAARVYPNGSIAAHVLGYVSEINASELKRLASQGYKEGDLIGKAGIEASMEDELIGNKAASLFIVGQDGKKIRNIADRPAQQGKTVQLTIDIDLQRKAEEALGNKVGSIVVIDPRDGSLLALVSHPAYDPNAFVLGLSAADWKKLSEDRTLPFQNRATLSAYPTGSIFKVVTMAAALESAGFTPDSQFNSPPKWTLPGTNQQFTDSLPQGHGQLNTLDGLAQSSNDVFYDMAYKLNSFGPNLLPDLAKDFGLGQPTGVEGLPEAAGSLPNPEWKQRVKNDVWYAGDAINLAIGQGYFEATPLQMANLYSTLANGGNLRIPLLVKRVGDGATAKEAKSEIKSKVPVSQPTLDAIREGMKRAATDPKGTAYPAFKGFQVPVAAKTGSAENQGPLAHAWFACFAPADNPEVVTIVMVEGGSSGGEVAAPIARRFLEGYFSSKQ